MEKLIVESIKAGVSMDALTAIFPTQLKNVDPEVLSCIKEATIDIAIIPSTSLLFRKMKQRARSSYSDLFCRCRQVRSLHPHLQSKQQLGHCRFSYQVRPSPPGVIAGVTAILVLSYLPPPVLRPSPGHLAPTSNLVRVCVPLPNSRYGTSQVTFPVGLTHAPLPAQRYILGVSVPGMPGTT